MNGDITLAALCHCQLASKVISPFVIFAIFDVSFQLVDKLQFFTFIFAVLLPQFKYRQQVYQKVCVTTVVRAMVNIFSPICLSLVTRLAA